MIDKALIAVLAIAILASLVFPLPVATLPLIVTACGLMLTWRIQKTQAGLAERKLFLDLMPRRAEWYDRVRLALEGREKERLAMIEAQVRGEVPPPPNEQSKLFQLETEAGWLFSSDMLALMAMLIEADKRLYETHLRARGGHHESAMSGGAMYLSLLAEQRKLQDYLVSYLYVGDIGKPKWSPVQFAKVQRRGPFGILGAKTIRAASADNRPDKPAT